MIDAIHVQNLALIRDAFIEPGPGLTVLTGETGAGKTALVSSVKLLMGERADTALIREGAGELTVEGSFYVPRGVSADSTAATAPATDAASTADADSAREYPGDESGQTVARRRLSKEGRSRVEINGHLASVGELSALVGAGIDLCGQHEHQRLLTASTHAIMLDSWGRYEHADLKDAAGRYRIAFMRAQDAAHELARIEELTRAGSERLDEARYTSSRIKAVNPQPGEYEAVKERLSVISHAEALARSAAAARELISDDEGALDKVAEATGALERVLSLDARLAPIHETIQTALFELEEASRDLARYGEDLEFDPGEFDALQSRMSALQQLMRSFGPGMDAVFSRWEKAAALVQAQEDSDALLQRARSQKDAAENELAAAADALDAARRALAPRLEARLSQEMQQLEMGSAAVVVEIRRLGRESWTPQSPSRIEFLYRPASGMSPRPLRKIASGGEISRVMLALKAVLGDADGADTLIFDEVDAGVSGKTALAVARLLRSLAEKRQVIVVTHLAQVAVAADTHYLVKKTEGVPDTLFSPSAPETVLEHISGDARVDEIARMLSGTMDTASRRLARQMLEGRS